MDQTLMTGGFAAMLLAAAVALAQQAPLRVEIAWNAPEEGSPAVRYEVQVVDPTNDFDHVYTVPAQAGTRQSLVTTDLEYTRLYMVRVCGIDAQGRAGPWSQWTPPYAFEVADPEP
jgi:hypothetical protein